MEQMGKITDEVKNKIADSEYLLIGIGSEWEISREHDVKEYYESLYQLIGEKDYFIVTTVTDGQILDSPLDADRISAPCGNENWQQCSKTCTKDIWEKGELPDGLCPHCGSPLTANTIAAECYIEEGYLPGWNAYKAWLARTLNRKLLILELGVDFSVPTVIRWPFEKTAFFNQKSHMYRVNKVFSQVPEEGKERISAVAENSLEFVRKCAD